MKIALAQLNYRIGDFENNVSKIIATARQAHSENADLVVFSELAISGYPPKDMLEMDGFIDKCEDTIDKISDACYNIPIIIGTPIRNKYEKGKPLFNAAMFLYQSKKQFFKKSLLPDYDIFDEYRYFEPSHEFEILNFNNKKIAVTICEDLWNIEKPYFYTTNPLDELATFKPDFVINIAASPFDYTQAERRNDILCQNVKHYKLPIIYVNQVGGHTELLFDGGSMAMADNGTIVKSLPFFAEKLDYIETESLIHTQNVENQQEIPSKIELMHDALVMGIKDYFAKLGFKKAIVGLSGGIDSALTTVLAVEALGAENVFGLLMPSRFSTNHSVKDALDLSKNLGCPHTTIAIEPMFTAFQKSLEPAFQNTLFDVTEENMQARIRAVLLMAMSNKFGNILLNTSNKSECAVGYGTLYGDMCGGISVLGDLYKTEVFEMSKWINQKTEIIPCNTINKAPSAELRPDQKDSDSLPDYDILDQILFQHIEKRKGLNEIVEMGFDEKTVARVLRLVSINEYKRNQAAPILRVSPKAFGTGRSMPITAKY